MHPHTYGTFWIIFYVSVVNLLILDACLLDFQLSVNGEWQRYHWKCSNMGHAHNYDVDNIHVYDDDDHLGHSYCFCTLYPGGEGKWPPSGFVTVSQHVNDKNVNFISNFTHKNIPQQKLQFNSHCNTDVTSINVKDKNNPTFNVGNGEIGIIRPHGMTLKIVCNESGYPTIDTPDSTTPTLNSQTPEFIATTTAVPNTVSKPRHSVTPQYSIPHHSVTPQYSIPRHSVTPQYSIPRHTVTPQYDKELGSESSPRKDSNNLLIGVAVGALLLFIVVIAIVIICVKKRSREGQAMVKYVKNTDTGPQYMNVPNHEQGPEYADASTIGVETGTEYAEIDIKRLAPKPQPNLEATDECAPVLVYADLAFETEAAGAPTNPNQATVNGGDALTDDDIAALYAKPMKKPK